MKARNNYPNHRAYRLLHNYGLTPVAESAVRAAQQQACAICKTPFKLLAEKEQHVDHSHETLEYRGILCGPCNRLLGMARDNATTLFAAAVYLNDKRGRLGYIGATMDLFHVGHVRFLKWAKTICKTVVVALNEDSFVATYKGAPPVQTLEERRCMVESCRYTDGVISNVSGKNSKETIMRVRPSHILCGSDWKDRTLYLQQLGIDEQFLSDNRIVISVFDEPRHFSTTELKERVKQQ